MIFASRYKFTLTIENAVCEDYISEKLWRALTVGSVPIYFGSPSVRVRIYSLELRIREYPLLTIFFHQDWLPNFDSAILIDEFREPEQLAAYIKRLDENDARYEDYLRHKLEGSISNKLLKKVLRSRQWWNLDSAIEEFECQLCLRLHRPGIKDSAVDERHYECDVTKTATGNSTSVQEWLAIFRSARCDGIILLEFVSRNETYSVEKLRRRSAQLMIDGDC